MVEYKKAKVQSRYYRNRTKKTSTPSTKTTSKKSSSSKSSSKTTTTKFSDLTAAQKTELRKGDTAGINYTDSTTTEKSTGTKFSDLTAAQQTNLRKSDTTGINYTDSKTITEGSTTQPINTQQTPQETTQEKLSSTKELTNQQYSNINPTLLAEIKRKAAATQTPKPTPTPKEKPMETANTITAYRPSFTDKIKRKASSFKTALISGFTFSPSPSGKDATFYRSEQATGLESTGWIIGKVGAIATLRPVGTAAKGVAAINTKVLTTFNAIKPVGKAAVVGKWITTRGYFLGRSAAVGEATYSGIGGAAKLYQTPEQKILARERGFTDAAQQSQTAERQSFKDKGYIKNFGYETTTFLGDKKVFEKTFREKYKGDDVEGAVQLALAQRSTTGYAELGAVFTQSASIERAGQFLLKPIKSTSKYAGRKAGTIIGSLGMIEAATTTITGDKARGRETNPNELAFNIAVGGLVAGTIGSWIYTGKNTPISKSLQKAVYLTDIDEYAGDKIADATGFFLSSPSNKKVPVFTSTIAFTNTQTKVPVTQPTTQIDPTLWADIQTKAAGITPTAAATPTQTKAPTSSITPTTTTPTNTKTPSMIFTNVPTNTKTKTPTNVQTNVPTNVQTNVPVNVFTPTNPLAFGGMFFGRQTAKRGFTPTPTRKSQIGKYTPSFIAISLNIRGTTKQKTFTGFEIRKIQPKKKKKINKWGMKTL